jgi:hypothetical protein
MLGGSCCIVVYNSAIDEMPNLRIKASITGYVVSNAPGSEESHFSLSCETLLKDL